MKIVIVEDEKRIAQRLERMLESILGDQVKSIHLYHSLTEALEIMESENFDLLFLDLNLNGQDGFEVLKTISSKAFHTIVVSAYYERALEAFEYGVLDFIPKPFVLERVQKALLRIQERDETHTRYLSCHKKGQKVLINVENILYIKGAGVYSEIKQLDGQVHLHNKSLDKLLVLLPTDYIRIHKSYIANMRFAQSIKVEPGSKYQLELSNNIMLPIGRTRYKEISKNWF